MASVLIVDDDHSIRVTMKPITKEGLQTAIATILHHDKTATFAPVRQHIGTEASWQ